jgi:hypothetical protein
MSPIIALFIDDAALARKALAPLLQAPTPGHVVLVACAPKLTHRVGRWLTRSSRDQYRERWSRELFAALQPLWQDAPRGTVETQVAKAPLPVLVQQLKSRQPGPVSIFDARRSRLGAQAEALQFDATANAGAGGWAIPLAVTSGASLALVLAD